MEEERATIAQNAMKATERIWENSVRIGTDKMTLEEINAEIRAARDERKIRRKKA